MRGAPPQIEKPTEKRCPRCDCVKPVTEFNINRKHKDGLASWCKSCNAENLREWAKKNATHKGRLSHASHLRRAYGIDMDDYDRMLEAQGGVCAICAGQCRIKTRLAVDHCHTTNRIRGLLCDDCNNGVGRFKDNPELLRAAAAYLETPPNHAPWETQ